MFFTFVLNIYLKKRITKDKIKPSINADIKRNLHFFYLPMWVVKPYLKIYYN